MWRENLLASNWFIHSRLSWFIIWLMNSKHLQFTCSRKPNFSLKFVTWKSVGLKNWSLHKNIYLTLSNFSLVQVLLYSTIKNQPLLDLGSIKLVSSLLKVVHSKCSSKSIPLEFAKRTWKSETYQNKYSGAFSSYTWRHCNNWRLNGPWKFDSRNKSAMFASPSWNNVSFLTTTTNLRLKQLIKKRGACSLSVLNFLDLGIFLQ